MNAFADVNPAASISELVDRLRLVKDAYRTFLMRWSTDRLTEDARAMESLISDLDHDLESGERPPILFSGRHLDD